MTNTTIDDMPWMLLRVERLGHSPGICSEWAKRYAAKHGATYRDAFRIAINRLESGFTLPIIKEETNMKSCHSTHMA